jgi:hypothetical protein
VGCGGGEFVKIILDNMLLGGEYSSNIFCFVCLFIFTSKNSPLPHSVKSSS